MKAIVEISGKQFEIEDDALIRVPCIPTLAEGDTYVCDKVLYMQKDDSKTVGTPYIKGANLRFRVHTHGRTKKTVARTYIRRKQHINTWGFRQKYTLLKLQSS